ncbi:hypothetical protein NCS57_01319000 [Fusarium keratoplasticum]|uniref:Uncharacterized protein n=1 Tax=Fusarium keratoplasticum TaxID=1328300 RepID=A0ACC0QF99_9HYPO|nr:hypothetical protein NCS57_01319000 [Fusarium keratoplasticum]KAI8652547.1 hypothetical protein NCS57_01319000 [Fusarium keratoplasticum]
MRHLPSSQTKGLFYQDSENHMLIRRIQCVPEGHGCQRCSERKLDCPGLTKAKRTKPRSPVLIGPSPSSTATTSSVTGTPLEAPSSASSELPAPETVFDLQPGYQWRNIWGAVTPEWTQSFPSDRYGSHWMFVPEAISETSTREPYAPDTKSEDSDVLDELQGLEIGLDFLDESEDEDETIYEEEETVGDDDDEKTILPDEEELALVELALKHLRDRASVAEMRKPILISYLKILRPNGSGNVECPFCQWSFNREQLNLESIRSHFRCCGDWAAATPLCSLDYSEQQHEIELREVMDKLQRLWSKRKPLPYRALPCLVCQTLCLADTFDGMNWHDEDNTTDMLDVGVYLACHKREIERLFAKAQARQQEWNSMDNDAREMEKARCSWVLECERSTYRRWPEMPQFNVLRDLNRVFSSRYRQFCQLAAESLSADLTSFIHELREKCPKPKDLRRLGTRIFKQVIQGTSPTTLLETFAFISLSQAMATVMHRRDIHINLDPGTVDYLSWRTCIEDEASRGLYDEILIVWFHPQWKDELHSGESNQSPLSAQEAMKRLVLQLMKAKQTNGAFKFSAFLNLDPFTPKQAHQASTCALQSLWDDDCEPSSSPAHTHPDKEAKDDPGGSGTEALINTAIFIGVWVFMIYISALGVALLYLGNPEQRCYLITGDGEEHVASARNVVLAAEKMKGRILDRLRHHLSLTALDGIVRAVEEVLDGGYVWSVSDLHICLEQAVQNHVEEPGLRSLLYTEIRHLCKEALNWVEPICERHRGGCMFVPVAL